MFKDSVKYKNVISVPETPKFSPQPKIFVGDPTNTPTWLKILEAEPAVVIYY